MGHNNVTLPTTLAQYLLSLRALGYEWIIAAGCNMDRALMQPWATSKGGVLVAPSAPACIQSAPGTTIDYFIMSEGVAIRSGMMEMVDTATIWPHRPVLMQVQAKDAVLWCRAAGQPKSLPALAKPGCGRFPRDWKQFHGDIQHATTADQLAGFWDLTVQGIEAELLGQREVAGPRRH
eukprot:6523569-Pyramimonas_sp.AAC.1